MLTRHFMRSLLAPAALGLGLLLTATLAGAQQATTATAKAEPAPGGAKPIVVDAQLPDYQKVGGISGNLSSVGSDTLNELMTLWVEAFKVNYPGVIIQVEGKGSATAPPALIAGTAQLGPMSREMKSDEIDAFEKKYGFKPVKVGVTLDALAVYVSKDNPIQSLTFPQLDAIFSKTRLRGASDITTWGQLGLTGDWANKPISLYGRNSASGTYGFFKEHVLSKGDFKDTVKEQPGSAAVVQGITSDLAGIGYSGIGYRTSGVKAVPLIETPRLGQGYEATYENVLNGKYPLGRMLYVYVVKTPNQPLAPLVKEFLTFVDSKQGQQVVVKGGFLPLPAKVANKQLEAIK